jgi:type I restriction enzyme S subunit
MKQKENSSLKQMVPNLRFPEFTDAGDWEERELGGIGTFLKGKGISKADITDKGKTPCIRYGELYTIYGETIDTVVSKTNLPDSELFLSQKNDVIVPSSGETKIDIARAACIKYAGIALGGDLNVLRSNQNGNFLSYLLNGPSKIAISKLAQGDTVVHLYSSQLNLLPIPIPSLPEQQKIADCLSSLDEVISLESQKLQSLQSYKKGLLQNIFPAEGETVPAMRFPEFKDAGDWEERKLGEVCDVQDGFAFKSFDFVDSAIGNVQVIRITDINNLNKNTSKVYVSNSLIVQNDLQRYFVEKGDLLLSLTGAAGFNFFIWDGSKSLMNQRTSKITPKDKSNLALRRLIEPLIYYKINVQGEGQNNNLSKEFLLDVEILLPSLPEQEKIADCLSAVDELIQEQSERVEKLNSHKKGLLQGLFPVIGE